MQFKTMNRKIRLKGSVKAHFSSFLLKCVRLITINEMTNKGSTTTLCRSSQWKMLFTKTFKMLPKISDAEKSSITMVSLIVARPDANISAKSLYSIRM